MAHVFGGLFKRHYPGLVRRDGFVVDAPATRWADYKLKEDGTGRTKYEDVLQEIWVSHQVYFGKHISSN